MVEPAPLTLPAGPLWQRRDKHTRGDTARPRLPRYAARATSPRRAVEDKAGAEQPGLDHLIYGYSATDAVQARVAFWRGQEPAYLVTVTSEGKRPAIRVAEPGREGVEPGEVLEASSERLQVGYHTRIVAVVGYVEEASGAS